MFVDERDLSTIPELPTHDRFILAHFATPRRNSAKLNRARFGVAMTRTKAKGIVNSIAQAAAEAKHEKTVRT